MFCVIDTIIYIFLGYFMEFFLKITKFYIYGFVFYLLGFFSALVFIYVTYFYED